MNSEYLHFFVTAKRIGTKTSLNSNVMNPLVNNKITTELNDSAGRLQPGQITEELLSQFQRTNINVKPGEILWNSGAERHFGCSSDMALGKRLWNFGITALGT